ncbi:MAG: metal-dependent hydrolase [Yoonia sp.]|nr:metal-dependent hydrolase [Yoonia sp.]MDG1863938.1 metal-dependent hydrolase [Yoonia sp.]
MNITWLGHSGFRIEIGDQILLVDPWITGNPSFPDGAEEDATQGATFILITHGHGDHAGDAVRLSNKLGAPLICIHELSEIWGTNAETRGMGKGGTQTLGTVSVTMVNAVHSSSIDYKGGIQYAGGEAGFIVKGEGHAIYISGDTDIMADMEWIGDYHKPNIGLICAGGHYTMDMAAVAYAAKRYFNFSTLIPSHFGTFGLLAQSAQPLIDALPEVNVLTPKPMEPITI